ncbi:Holliday junction branch migration protein RuvA [Alicyclobacillus herbarius]|uniref:Holliday junction branch migration protein RuvA n=1 Tax=Alicyclobacillus herbarius TaxID=122960 RepID=UPI00041A01A7|nr:Holliday junction branch migration protein RuvA [Alicyclobacillus herbarius]
MIVFVRGKVHNVGLSYLDVDVHGIGYRVLVPAPVMHQVRLGQDVFLYTYRHLREDADELYGFLDEQDRDWFELLLGVSGIGPKGALQILSEAERDEFYAAVLKEDAAALCRFPGVGKKTAQRIILELREKVPAVLPVSGTKTSSSPGSPSKGTLPADDLAMDVVEALIGLGYNERQASEAVAQVFVQGQPADAAEAIRACLRHLAGVRA